MGLTRRVLAGHFRVGQNRCKLSIQLGADVREGFQGWIDPPILDFGEIYHRDANLLRQLFLCDAFFQPLCLDAFSDESIVDHVMGLL